MWRTIRRIISCGRIVVQRIQKKKCKCKRGEMCLPKCTVLIKLKYVHSKQRRMIPWIISGAASCCVQRTKKCKSGGICLPRLSYYSYFTRMDAGILRLSAAFPICAVRVLARLGCHNISIRYNPQELSSSPSVSHQNASPLSGRHYMSLER